LRRTCCAATVFTLAAYLNINRKQACEVAAMEQFDKNRQEGEAEAEKRGMTAMQYAMFHFEFAPCKQCRLPFFVRAHDCGADAAAEAGGAAVDPPMPVGDMLCGTCREARGGVVTCSIHGKDSIMWKCRYCCKMATYECFGCESNRHDEYTASSATGAA
jgi:hypothetical protein